MGKGENAGHQHFFYTFNLKFDYFSKSGLGTELTDQHSFEFCKTKRTLKQKIQYICTCIYV